MGRHLNLDGETLNLDGGTLTFDEGTRPPYNLSSACKSKTESKYIHEARIKPYTLSILSTNPIRKVRDELQLCSIAPLLVHSQKFTWGGGGCYGDLGPQPPAAEGTLKNFVFFCQK